MIFTQVIDTGWCSEGTPTSPQAHKHSFSQIWKTSLYVTPIQDTKNKLPEVATGTVLYHRKSLFLGKQLSTSRTAQQLE